MSRVFRRTLRPARRRWTLPEQVVVSVLILLLTGCTEGCQPRNTAVEETPSASSTTMSCADDWAMGWEKACAHYPGIGWGCQGHVPVKEPTLWAPRGHSRWQGLEDDIAELTLSDNGSRSLMCGRRASGEWGCVGYGGRGLTADEAGSSSSLSPAPALAPPRSTRSSSSAA